MGERAFPVENIESKTGEGRVFASRIECAVCEAVAYYAKPKNVNHIAVEQHFRNQGWFVGNGPRADKCAQCQKSKKPILKVVKMENAKAEPPREMSRDDRRIITMKLDDIYADQAYQAPWTDAAVARDLNVPRAWVADVREQFFGPEGSNSEFDEFLAKAAPIIADLKNLHRSVHAQLEQAKAISAKVDEIERIGKRIEKEIGR